MWGVGGGGVEWAGFCEGIEEWVIWALTISLVSRWMQTPPLLSKRSEMEQLVIVEY